MEVARICALHITRIAAARLRTTALVPPTISWLQTTAHVKVSSDYCHLELLQVGYRVPAMQLCSQTVRIKLRENYGKKLGQ